MTKAFRCTNSGTIIASVASAFFVFIRRFIKDIFPAVFYRVPKRFQRRAAVLVHKGLVSSMPRRMDH